MSVMERRLQPGELSEILCVLADEERRRVLSQLRAHDGVEISLDDLAAACSTGDPEASTVTPVRLHHVTLPKLAAADLVHYDQEAKIVVYRGDNAVETLVDRMTCPEPTVADVVTTD